MPASSEIRFKIGADTSALSSAFDKAKSVAAVAGKEVQKRFGLKDAFRSLMTGIGIGSVDAIADAVVRPFEIAMERAKDLVNLTTRLREIQVQEIVAQGGRKTGLDMMRREVNDLSDDINMQKNLIASLPQHHPLAAPLLREAEQELINLQVRQAELQSKIKIEVAATNRATKEWAREQSTIEDIASAELREAGEREKLQIRLNHLQREYVLLMKRGDFGTDRERQNLGQQFAIQNQMKILASNARQEMAVSLASLGADLAGRDPSRKPKPRSRGRSEMERIADRGELLRAQAEEALRTGRSPQFVASLTSRANRDMTASGEKAAAQASMVNKEVARALGGIFQKAVTELQEIRKNLTPTNPGKGK